MKFNYLDYYSNKIIYNNKIMEEDFNNFDSYLNFFLFLIFELNSNENNEDIEIEENDEQEINTYYYIIQNTNSLTSIYIKRLFIKIKTIISININKKQINSFISNIIKLIKDNDTLELEKKELEQLNDEKILIKEHMKLKK
jgi:hypothetical protein